MVSEAEVLAALPKWSWLREYVEYAAGRTACHIKFHVGNGLVCLAQTTPIPLTMDFGSPVYTNLFMLAVGPSTKGMKSAGASVSRRLLEKVDQTTIGAMPGSWEGLHESITKSNRQVIFYSEFGKFLSMSERGYMMPVKTNLIDVFDCAPLTRALAKDKGAVKVVQNPRVSIVAACTPGLLERHTEPTDWTEGFLARFLTLAVDDLHPAERIYPRPTKDSVTEMKLAERLKAWRDPMTPFAECIGFDEASAAFWDKWYLDMYNFEAPNNEVAPAVARAPGLALRIALLLGWDRGDGREGKPWTLTRDLLEVAAEIVSWHVESVLYVGDRIASSIDMRQRRAVLRAVKAHPRPLGEIIREAQLLKKRTLEIIETLIEEKTIEKVTVNSVTAYALRVPANRPLAKVIPIHTPMPPPSSSPPVDLFGDPVGDDNVVVPLAEPDVSFEPEDNDG